ncbi:MAG: DUF3987 domain-containing protein [Hydrococcus sp. RM1_1_31]|nr:DUF3987 domain-containing protein [Hydrococcus sp. RM1_1_31]
MKFISRFDSEALQVNALMDLASDVGRPYRDIELLTRIVKRQKDFDDDVATAISKVSTNLRHFRQRLDLKRYLEPNFASLLLDAASSMPTAPEYLFNPLLSTTASLVGTAARILVNPGGGYVQPMIFWTGNIAHSGQAKTPPQKVVVQPLADLEAEAYTVYEEEAKEYEKDKSTDASPPRRKRFLLNNVTIPLKIRIHSENPRGLLEYLDELVSDYTRLNQYKRGVGDDLQQELTFFNGDNNNYDRGDVRLLLKRTGFSKTGTYQWDTLARLMEDEVNFVASGYSARFLLCSILDAPIRYLDLFKSNDAVQKFQTALRELYESLSRLSVSDYLLTSEAKVLFEAWNHTLVDAEMLEEHFGLSLVYSKIEAYTARLALWLHIVNALLRNEIPAPVISGTTMQHAIEIASFYLWQHKSIHAHNSPTRQLEGVLLKAQTQAEKYFSRTGKGIGASWLKTRLNALKNWCVEKSALRCFKF